MCGRYTLKTPIDALAEHFGVEFPALGPRFNVAPSQAVPAITAESVKLLKWGFVPGWSREPAVKFSNINARCEAVATSAAYRGSFRHKRCLLPADGFYEWAPGPPKVPHHFRLKDGGPFAFAGIWDSWERGDSGPLETCALITTEANEVVGRVHGRMPVVLKREDYQAWLDPSASADELLGMLGPLPAELMVGWAVGPMVNRPGNDGPGCAVPA